ncbi:MAG TPA: GyrI-like domain-containing protein [Rubrivivax sp.]|nr:GyrI-like domain-containing protein [Rubrivivax sp.]
MPATADLARDSRAEYERRVHRVIAYIDAHIDQPLALETLAGVAHFSPFHFHRLFTAWTGETLGDYLRRRRVELGALRLATQPRLGVLQVALAVGFGSGEAFTRAFSQRFGLSPTAWRRERQRKIDQAQGKLDQAAFEPPQDHGLPVINRMEDTMKVSLTDFPPTHVAYFRHVGPYGEGVMRLWMEQVAPWMEENGLMRHVRYGVGHDDPAITEPARCRYDACVELAPDAVVSGQPQRCTLPGGRYACLAFEGTNEQIEGAWQQLLRDWLPSSGLQLDNRPMLEHYPEGSRFDPATGVFTSNLCIPVSKL